MRTHAAVDAGVDHSQLLGVVRYSAAVAVGIVSLQMMQCKLEDLRTHVELASDLQPLAFAAVRAEPFSIPVQTDSAEVGGKAVRTLP